ncbi:MAG: hypothetical protein M3082_16150 [Candidatus Dormibacteraeota bacterium]|nr:hypothetical protein [Candidatus Dormibacteraeota bacterium]
MKRLVLTAIAITACTLTLGLETVTASPPRLLGGLDLNGYCQSLGYEGARVPGDVITGHTTFNDWRCVKDGSFHPFSFEQACQWQYGLNAVQAHPLDKNDAFSWRCYSVGRP